MAAEPIDSDVDLTDERQRGELSRSHHAVLAFIAAGGAAGATARYGAGLLWPTPDGSFPWTTLGVNAVGCLLIGVLMAVLAAASAAPAWVRPFLGTGVLGGFTTFSTFSVDIQGLLLGGRPGVALAYLAATPVAALIAVTAGSRVARGLLSGAGSGSEAGGGAETGVGIETGVGAGAGSDAGAGAAERRAPSEARRTREAERTRGPGGAGEGPERPRTDGRAR
ncbi:fluoride efflux transporter FluC [Streptosporangium sandarakinum]|uniref:fluoride efflux transporter FluC n=1 Tax=Streptosporangium sandarakinum TaxID=1260955 RepID=UPI003D92BCB2